MKTLKYFFYTLLVLLLLNSVYAVNVTATVEEIESKNITIIPYIFTTATLEEYQLRNAYEWSFMLLEPTKNITQIGDLTVKWYLYAIKSPIPERYDVLIYLNGTLVTNRSYTPPVDTKDYITITLLQKNSIFNLTIALMKADLQHGTYEQVYIKEMILKVVHEPFNVSIIEPQNNTVFTENPVDIIVNLTTPVTSGITYNLTLTLYRDGDVAFNDTVSVPAAAIMHYQWKLLFYIPGNYTAIATLRAYYQDQLVDSVTSDPIYFEMPAAVVEETVGTPTPPPTPTTGGGVQIVEKKIPVYINRTVEVPVYKEIPAYQSVIQVITSPMGMAIAITTLIVGLAIGYYLSRK